MAIDLLKLEKKFIDLFANVTQEEFEQWLLTKTKPMAQQSAVEWLIMQLPVKIRVELYEQNIHEQAKQMEREQKIGLLNWMNKVSKVDPMRLETDHDDIVDQYYNETYNQNK